MPGAARICVEVQKAAKSNSKIPANEYERFAERGEN